jgi:hypothetical protein
MRVAAILCGILALSACASPPKPDLTPAQMAFRTAYEARQRTAKACLAEPRQTFGILVECLLGADRRFLDGIGYRDAAAWAVYAGRTRQVATEADAGQITEDQFAARVLQIKRELGRPMSLI